MSMLIIEISLWFECVNGIRSDSAPNMTSSCRSSSDFDDSDQMMASPFSTTFRLPDLNE